MSVAEPVVWRAPKVCGLVRSGNAWWDRRRPGCRQHPCMLPRVRLIGVLLALLLAGHAGAPPPTRAVPLDVALAAHLRRLVEPIESCIVRHDTENAVFGGCFDWHSAVHANLTLRVAARLLPDAELRALAEDVATPEGVALEHAALEGGLLEAERPYGYAWLLLLDIEAGRADIHAMASDAARRVRGGLARALADESLALSTRYRNSSFPVFALHRWYSRFSPARAAGFAAFAAPRLEAHVPLACAPDRGTNGFFDPCASLLLALSQLAGQSDAVDRGQLREMAINVAAQRPLKSARMRSIFQAGLNFSRAWALYAAAGVLDERAFIDRGDRLFRVNVAQPAIWHEGYEDYSHWVAQFGVFALQLRGEVSLSPATPYALPTGGLPWPGMPWWWDGQVRHLPTTMRPV